MYGKLLITFVIMCLPAMNLFSQLEFNNWFLGGESGITFNTVDGSPESIDDFTDLSGFEGNATISDFKGELLLFTNGRRIWNKYNKVIGIGPMENLSATQAALIVPNPVDRNIYYVFMTDDCEIGSNNLGAGYMSIDLSMNGGLGGIKEPYYYLFSPSTEKLTAACHANGKDYWVITHGISNNIFNVYAVTENGVSHTPIQSAVGIVHDSIVYGNDGKSQGGAGEMKVSLQCNKIALAIESIGIVQYFDFFQFFT